MARKLTQEEFIQRARKVHGNKYDYSKVEYKGSKTKVCIICPLHGEFWQSPNHHLRGCDCPKCAIPLRNLNPKRVGVDRFKERANIIHNNKYDYSLVNFTNTIEYIEIICPIHGIFRQVASEHLRGCGCSECGKNIISIKNRKEKLYGIAEHDIFINDNGVISKMWRRMLNRCYSAHYHKYNPCYIGCMVCDEWLKLSNFYKWVQEPKNGYKVGYHLDKDLLLRNNRIYSPDTCCFVPREINEMLPKINKSIKNKVCVTKSNKFYVRIYAGGKYIKGKTFNTFQEAAMFYKYCKEQYIKELAEKYYHSGKITEKVYNALINYEVEITD